MLSFLKKRVLYVMYTVVFLLMFIWNTLTPLYADDLYASHKSLRDIISLGIHDYFMWNGRVVGQSMMRILSSSNYIIASLLNAACFVALMHLILKLSSDNKDHKVRSIKYVVIISVSFIFIPAFGQTVLWRAGSGNYLWTTTLNLLFIYLFTSKKFLAVNSSIRALYGLKLIFFNLLAVLAGWSNENTSGGTILLLLLYLVYWKLTQRKIFFNRLIGLFFCGVGYLALLCSPGNKIRTRITMGEDYLKEPLLKKLLTGIFNVSNSMINMYLPLLLALVILIVLMYHYWFSNEKLIEGLIWAFSGVAIIYALCFSPIGQDGGRAFFGGVIYLIVALIKVMPSSNVNLSKSLKVGFELGFFMLIMVFTLYFLSGFTDSVRASRAIGSRFNTIQNQKKKVGTKAIIDLPHLEYWPKTKYGINNGLDDIGKNPDVWPNAGYKMNFGVKGVRLKD